MAPGILVNKSSPSHVLHSQPLREIFCINPARSPVEYDHDKVIHTYAEKITPIKRTSPVIIDSVFRIIIFHDEMLTKPIHDML